jgi:hypothetical protein
MNVEADLDRVLELQQWRQPTRSNRTRVADHDQAAGVLVLQPHVVAGHLKRRRSDQIGQRTGAEREAALLRGKILDRLTFASLQPQHAYRRASAGAVARTARVV